jgi:hypothetical protein
MKYDLTQTILDIHGKVAQQKYTEMIEVDGEEKQNISAKPLTLGGAISDSVLLQIDEKEEPTEENHLLRYGIYEKVNNGDSEFTPEEMELIKKCITKRYVPLYAGQLLRILNK